MKLWKQVLICNCCHHIDGKDVAAVKRITIDACTKHAKMGQRSEYKRKSPSKKVKILVKARKVKTEKKEPEYPRVKWDDNKQHKLQLVITKHPNKQAGFYATKMKVNRNQLLGGIRYLLNGKKIIRKGKHLKDVHYAPAS